MRQEGNTLIADDDMHLVRKSDDFEFASSVELGKIFYINGVKLDTPHVETIEDFYEIPTF